MWLADAIIYQQAFIGSHYWAVIFQAELPNFLLLSQPFPWGSSETGQAMFFFFFLARDFLAVKWV